MKIYMARGGVAMTNAFLVADEKSRKAVLFDAPDHTAGQLLDRAREEGLDVIGLWLTHGHFDHIADHQVVTDRFPDAKVLIHRLDEPMLKLPQSEIFALPFSIAPRAADRHVEDGQRMKIGSIDVEAIHTPGHSPGHVMYYLPEEKALIGGDLIIGGSVGRTDLPNSDAAALRRSIRRIMKLPGDTRLLPGHGDAGTLGHELETNPFVREAMEENEG